MTMKVLCKLLSMFCVVLFACGPSKSGGGTQGGTEESQHGIGVVFVIVMENHAANQIYGNTTHAPYINETLLPAAARAGNYQDDLPALPSEPHYIWMEAGTNSFSDWVFLTDADPSSLNSTDETEHLVSQMKTADVSWMAYQEDLNASTGACPTNSSGYYAAKHDPFVFFTDVAGDPPSSTNAYCAAHHKPFSALTDDLAAGSVAAFNFITPNQCHNMHGQSGCPSDTVKAGDDWLAAQLPSLIDYVNLHNGVIVVAWDEPETSGGMPLFVLGPHVKNNYASPLAYSHSSLLKSLEEIFGLPILADVAAANDFSDLFEPTYFP